MNFITPEKLPKGDPNPLRPTTTTWTLPIQKLVRPKYLSFSKIAIYPMLLREKEETSR